MLKKTIAIDRDKHAKQARPGGRQSNKLTDKKKGRQDAHTEKRAPEGALLLQEATLYQTMNPDHKKAVNLTYQSV